MIVKVQRSLMDPPGILIYDKPVEDGEEDGAPIVAHQIFEQLHALEAEIRHLLGDDLKGYFEATIEGEKIVLGDRVPEEDW